MDRLPELLERITASEAEALARLLARNSNPFGPQAEIWCTHSSHRKPHRKKVIGVQRWFLEDRSWIPVVGDPFGRELVRPAEAWTDVNGRALEACLPRSSLPSEVAARLEIPSATAPHPGSIVGALVSSREAHPDLSKAPDDVLAGCEVLIAKLEASLKRWRKQSYQGPTPPFPAITSEGPSWHEEPAVADVPFPRTIPIPVLPQGSWEEITEEFSLPLASSFLTVIVEPEGAEPAELEDLPPVRKIQLTALLASKRGADLRLIARRLGRLEIQSCKTVRVHYEGCDVTAVETREVYLQGQNDDSANLYIVEPRGQNSRAELARVLARHLGCPEEGEAVLAFLLSGEELLHFHQLSPAALEEAEAAMQRYRTGDPAASRTESPPPGPSIEPEPQRGSDVPDGEQTVSEESPISKDGPGGPSPPPPRKIRMIGKPSVPSDELNIPQFGAVVFAEDGQEQVKPSTGPGPSGARGGTGASGSPGLRPKARQDVEQAGIELAKRFAREHLACVDVRDVQVQNKGWDLEFVRSSQEWWPVEVKSFSASAQAFILTRNELDAAESRKDCRILVITGIGQGHGHVIELEPSAAWLATLDLEPMSWKVSGWQEGPRRMFQWRDAPATP